MALDPLVVEHDLLHRLIADLEKGPLHPAEHYQELFPGHEVLVAKLVQEAATPVATADAKQLGMFGSFEPIELIGRGGQGVVYLARDTKLPRMVALKVLAGSYQLDRVRQQRFRREAEVAARLDHPGLCRVLEFGIQNEVPYLAMPFVSGTSLAAALADKGKHQAVILTTSSLIDTGTAQSRIHNVLTLISKVAQALHVAHEQGVVHRDVKPANIMITPAGEPVVLDFGLARDEETSDHSLTMSSDMMGTPAYMAPEQITGTSRPDRRTDVFALAVVLYECLTGMRPFDAPTRQQMFDRVVRGQFEPASRIVAGLPRDIDQVLGVALDVARDRRYETAQAFAEDLQRVVRHEPVRARPVGWAVHLQRWVRRNRLLAASLIAVVIVSIGAMLMTTSAWIRADSARKDSDAINEFLLHDMLAASNPSGLGREARVVDALQRCSSRIDSRLGHSPLLAATVRFEIAKTYAALGLWDESRELASQALTTRRELLGARSPEALQVELAVASSLAKAREYAKARPALKELLPRLNAEHGANSVESLHCRTMLCYSVTGQKVPAAALDESLAILNRCSELFGPTADVSRLARANRMALLQRANRITEFVSLAKQQVQLTTERFGATSFLAIESRLAYCNGLRMMGQLQEAVALLPDLIQEAKSSLGENHPDYLLALQSLGSCYSSIRMMPKAIEQLRIVKDRATAVLGSEHRWTLEFSDDLAKALKRDQRLDEAQKLADKTLAIKERVFGSNSAEVAGTLTTRSSIFRLANDWPNAIADSQRAVTIMEDLVGPDDPAMMLYVTHLGFSKQLSGDVVGAKAVVRRQLQLAKRAFGTDNHWHAKALMQLCVLTYSQGQFKEAESYANECLEFREVEKPVDIDQLENARAWAAMTRYRQGRKEGVQAVLEASWNAMANIDRLKFHMQITDYFTILEEIYTREGDDERLRRMKKWMEKHSI